jgi:hypothetical protein
MAKGSKSSFSSGSNSSSDFGLSNLHLMGGAVGVNTCLSDDTSFYCNLSRFSSSVSMIVQLIAILAIIYFLAKYFLFKRK